MFGWVSFASRRSGGRPVAGFVIAAAASAFLGACAHNPGDMPGLQWQVNTVDAAGAAPPAYGTAEAPASSGYAANGEACCVYRGGRDPNTGLAYTQL